MSASDQLTPRELQVIREVARGRSNRQISRSLGISEKTVKNHLSSIYTKLGVNCRIQAALIFLEAAPDHPAQQAS